MAGGTELAVRPLDLIRPLLVAGSTVPPTEGRVLDREKQVVLIGLVGPVAEGATGTLESDVSMGCRESGVVAVAAEAGGSNIIREGGSMKGMAEKAATLLDELVSESRFLRVVVTLQAEETTVVHD